MRVLKWAAVAIKVSDQPSERVRGASWPCILEVSTPAPRRQRQSGAMIGKDNGFPSIMPSDRRTLIFVMIAAWFVYLDGQNAVVDDGICAIEGVQDSAWLQQPYGERAPPMSPL